MRDKDTSALREYFNIPLHCDPHLNQTKFNELLPLTIPGVLVKINEFTVDLPAGRLFLQQTRIESQW